MEAMEINQENETEEMDYLSSFGVEILKVIKESQAQHGLRHGDFQRYHGYCNRRLRRLRKAVGFKMGDKKRVTPKKITDALVKDARYLLIMVMTTERAWSYAMQLKHTGRDPARSKHHMIRRLRKAAAHATTLNDLCNNSEKVDGHTKLESQAYCCYVNGLYRFEMKEWKVAMEQFTQTQTIYEKMCEALNPEDHGIYKQMIEELAPSIRYCAYNIGDQSAMNDLMQLRASARQDLMLADKLDSLIVDAKAKKAASMSEVKWKSHTIPIKADKVRVFFIALKEFEEQILNAKHENQLEMYEGLLSDCKDALQCVKEELKNDSKVAGDNITSMQLLHSYLSYIRVEKTVKRNLLLVDNLKNGLEIMDLFTNAENTKSTTKPSDFIRIYDLILQNLSEILTLPGVTGDENEMRWVKGQITAFKAIKCFFIGQAYVHLKKWQEGIALYERVLKYASESREILQLVQRDEYFVNFKDLDDLVEVIAFSKYRVHASAIMQTLDESTKKSEGDVQNVALLERLNDYRESLDNDLQMTSAYPPNFQPIPCKPLFFDLALNHLSFPALDDKMGSKQGQKAGISGYFKGWLGWGARK